MQLQERKQKKSSTNKITIKVPMQGKNIPVKLTVAQLASLIKKLNSENNAISVENLPTQDEVTEFIEKQSGDFRHSMPDIMQHFFDGSKKGSYHQMYRMAKKAREHLEEKHNGQFIEEKQKPKDGNPTPIREITIWYIQPKPRTT